MPEERTVFVTVGTTRFDALVLAALRREVQAVLRDQGYTKVLIQKGNSDVEDVDKEGESCITFCQFRSMFAKPTSHPCLFTAVQLKNIIV